MEFRFRDWNIGLPIAESKFSFNVARFADYDPRQPILGIYFE